MGEKTPGVPGMEHKSEEVYYKYKAYAKHRP